MNYTHKSRKLNMSKFIYLENCNEVLRFLFPILIIFKSETRAIFLRFNKNLFYIKIANILSRYFIKFKNKLAREFKIDLNTIDKLCRQFFEIPIAKNCA